MERITTPPPPAAAEGCDGCSGRRDFLRQAGALAASLLLGLGASPAAAAALPVTLTRALERRGNEVRYPLPATDGVVLDREHSVILARYQGAVYAFGLSCPHQNTALKWLEKETRFQCPKHKSRYRPDGTYISGRATRSMDRYSLRLDVGALVVDTGTLHREDKDRAAWSAAFLKL